MSHENTIGFSFDGEELVFPSVIDGKQLNEREVVGLFRQGLLEPLGRFATVEEANAFAQQRSKAADQQSASINWRSIGDKIFAEDRQRQRGAVEEPDRNQAKREALGRSLYQASRVNHGQEAEAQSLARDLGVPTASTRANMDAARQMKRDKDINSPGFWREYPLLGNWLSDPDNAAIAYKDVPTLKRHNDLFTMMGQKWVEQFRAANENEKNAMLVEARRRIQRASPEELRELGAKVGQKDDTGRFGSIVEESVKAGGRGMVSSRLGWAQWITEAAARTGVPLWIPGLGIAPVRGLQQDHLEQLSAATRRLAERWQDYSNKQLEAGLPKDMTLFERGLSAGVTSGVQTIDALATGSFARAFMSSKATAAAMATMFGAATAGQEFTDIRQRLGFLGASGFAATQGAIEGLTEMMPGIRLIEGLQQLPGGLFRAMRRFLGQEIPNEQVATFAQDFIAWSFDPANANVPASEFWRARLPAAAETAIATVVAGGAQMGVIQGLDRVLNQEQREKDRLFILALGDEAKRSELRKADSKRYEQLIATLGEDTVESVGIPAPRFTQYFQEQDMDPDLVAKELGIQNYDAAVLSGTDVQIPIGAFANQIAATPHGQGLLDDLRIGDGFTAREWREVESGANPELRKKIIDRMFDITKEQQSLQPVDDAVEQIIADAEQQLIQAGEAPDVARSQAEILRGVAIMGVRSYPNMNPVEAATKVWNRVGLKIERMTDADLQPPPASDNEGPVGRVLYQRIKDLRDIKKLTWAEAQAMIPEDRRAASKDPRLTIEGGEFSERTDLDEHGPGFFPTQQKGEAATDTELKALMQKAIEDSGLERVLDPKVWAKFIANLHTPTAADMDAIFKLVNRARYWYELSTAGMTRQYFDMAVENLELLIDMVAGTSGGQNPRSNLRVALAILSQHMRKEPVTVGVRDEKSATDALSDANLSTLKFGNFSGTMQLLGGFRESLPLPTIDLQMADLHKVPQSLVATEPRLYLALSNFWIGVRDMQNALLPEGMQPYESWQAQALAWVWNRKSDDPDDYASALPNIIAELEKAGVVLKDGRITEETLMDPRIVDILAPSAREFETAPIATLETASLLTDEGREAAAMFAKIKNIPAPWARIAREKYVSIHSAVMRTLGTRPPDPTDPKKKRKLPSPITKLFRAATGNYSLDVARIDTGGMGSFEGDVNGNMRIPLGGRGSSGWQLLNDVQQDGVLAILGKELNQAASAASKFTLTDDPSALTHVVFIPRTERPHIDPGMLEAFGRDVGSSINYKRTINGWVIEINPNFGDSGPIPVQQQVVDEAIRKNFGDEDVRVVSAHYESKYQTKDEYDEKIGGLIDGFDKKADSGRGKGARDRRQQRRDLVSAQKEIAAAAKQRDKSLAQWTASTGERFDRELERARKRGVDLYQTEPTKEVLGLFRRMESGQMTIGLFAGRDLSTFLHETGHMYFELLRDLSQEADVSQQIKDDYNTLLAFVGLKPGDEITTAAHEKLARAFEKYLMEGKAPAPALVGAFRRFKAWLQFIYEAIRRRSLDDVRLSDDVRGVFDRILATDQEIVQAALRLNQVQMISNAAQVGMSPEQFKQYSEVVGGEVEAGKEHLLKKAMEQQLRERTRAWKDERKRVLREVATEVEQMKSYIAADALAAGQLPDGTAVRLNRESMVQEFGKDTTDQLRRYVRADGNLDAGHAAELFGFNSGQELTTTLLATLPKQQYIRIRANQVMAERHGDMLHDGTIAEEAMASLLEEGSREKIIRMELSALRKKVEEVKPIVRPLENQLAEEKQKFEAREAELRRKHREALQATQVAPPRMYREYARSAIAQATVRNIMPQKYLQAMIRASQASSTALANGDAVEAAIQKQREMVALHLYVEANNARKEVGDVQKYIKTFDSKAKRERIAKAQTTGNDYLGPIDTLINRYGFRRTPIEPIEGVKPLNSWATEYNQKFMNEAVVHSELLDDRGQDKPAQSFKDVTLDELRAVRDQLKNIEHLARAEGLLIYRDKTVSHERAVKELADQIAKTFPEVAGRVSESAKSRWQEFKERAQGVDAGLLRMQRLIQWLDGGNINGPWHTYFWHPLKASQHSEDRWHKRVSEKLDALLATMPKDWHEKLQKHYDHPQLGKITHQDILGFLFNMGNEGNLQKLLDNNFKAAPQEIRSWVIQQADHNDGRFVQGVWDIIEGFWPEIAALERRLNGIEPRRVKRIPLTLFKLEETTDEVGRPVTLQTEVMTLPGGYWPLAADHRSHLVHEKQQSDLFRDGLPMAITHHGFTKDRTKAQYELTSNFSTVLAKHVSQVIHDNTHRAELLAVWKLINDPRIQAELDNRVGAAYGARNFWGPWLRSIANSTNQSIADGLDGWNRLFTKTRARTQAAIIGGRLSTVMVQFSAIFPAMTMVKKTYLARGVLRLVKHPQLFFTDMFAKSGEMEFRTRNFDRDVKLRLEQLRGEKGWSPKVEKAAYWGIAATDVVTAGIAWWGAYEQAKARGMDEAASVAEADRVVGLTQGAASTMDLAPIQRRSAGSFWLAVTMFYGYFSMQYNLGRDIIFNTRSVRDVPRAASQAFFGFVVPLIIADTILGRSPWSTDDEEDSWLTWAMFKALLSPLATIPLVRDVGRTIEVAADTGRFWTPSFSPMAEMFVKATKAAIESAKVVGGDEEADSQFWIQLAEAMGFALGIPVTGQAVVSARYLDRVRTGEEEPESIWEQASGIMFGKRRE